MSRELPVAREQTLASPDRTLVLLLKELKSATHPETVRKLSAEIERVVFHK